jgi:hypothetical protein
VHSETEFLNNPPAQEAAFAAYMSKIQAEILDNKMHWVIGQTIQGRLANFEITFPGLMAAAHRQGAPILLDYILFQRAHDWQSDQIAPQAIKDWYREKYERTLSDKDAEGVIIAFNRIERRMRIFSDQNYFRGASVEPGLPAGP